MVYQDQNFCLHSQCDDDMLIERKTVFIHIQTHPNRSIGSIAITTVDDTVFDQQDIKEAEEYHIDDDKNFLD